MFAEYTATPCMERTGERVENKELETKNIKAYI